MTTLPRALRTRLNPGGSAVLRTRDEAISLGALTTGNPLSVELGELRGAHVLLKTRRQISAAMALIALDGIAARIVIAPPDLKPDHIENIIQRAEIDTLVTDGEPIAGLRHVSVLTQSTEFLPRARSADGGDDRSTGQVRRPEGDIKTEWVMFTSGTTGVPKMVAHSLEALTGAIKSMGEGVTWGTFYDIRRYGGLQIFLRAMLGDASLILSDADENIADFLARLGRDGVTHLTGTPSHWRRALMSPAIEQVHPCYVRLSGEIADQAVLDSLKDRFPVAAMGHAYASTEAGVGFEVTDGREGFPASLIGGSGPVEMRVVDGTLQIRSSRTASRFIGSAETLVDQGFVDTGDMVELKGDRYYFVGRRGGIINVGGLKIHPEEVEAVINRHPAVRLSRVSGRKNPITGAIVVAEVVLDGDKDGTVEEILQNCRAHLKPIQVPAMVRVVPKLELSAGGKLLRNA